jgi:hypothetical protein
MSFACFLHVLIPLPPFLLCLPRVLVVSSRREARPLACDDVVIYHVFPNYKVCISWSPAARPPRPLSKSRSINLVRPKGNLIPSSEVDVRYARNTAEPTCLFATFHIDNHKNLNRQINRITKMVGHEHKRPSTPINDLGFDRFPPTRSYAIVRTCLATRQIPAWIRTWVCIRNRTSGSYIWGSEGEALVLVEGTDGSDPNPRPIVSLPA